MDKKELRKYIKSQVSSISSEDREVLSKSVTESILITPEWKKAEEVFLFSSIPDEIDTKYLIESALSENKRVILPVIRGEEIDLYYYDSNKIVVGTFGILEPSTDSEKATVGDIDLAIIPGRAFTKEGKRLGRGKGYYDRLLPSLSCLKWGICYPCQIVDDIAVDPWDIPMDKVFF